MTNAASAEVLCGIDIALNKQYSCYSGLPGRINLLKYSFSGFKSSYFSSQKISGWKAICIRNVLAE